jgi:chemosensory pili system protein ChpA (sensor histidine kinase/response regulator)
MNSTTDVAPSDDISALAWVQDELRRSLDTAHKALRRFVKENEAAGGADLDAVDPAILRTARSQIHQGVGALELVGQQAAATVLRASEALIQRFIAKPHKLTARAVDDIERASFSLLDYLTRLLAGRQVSTLSLFPQYRAVQEAAGAERVHPADLWAHDWQWRDLPDDPTAQARPHDAATHAALEAQLLPLMRAAGPLQAAAHISDIAAGLGAGASERHVATLWKLAAAVFEAQAQGLLGFDVFSKRVASRLLAQYRILERGESEVSERLAQDLLFFCAQSASPGDGRKAPRLAAVRQAYGLAHHVPTDYTVSALGRFDPAVIVQARKRVAAAKDGWSAVAGGEMHRMTGLSEQFALVGESLKRLFPFGEAVAAELQQAVAQTQHSGEPPTAALAMEVATSLLYVEASLEDADFDHPEQADRVRRLAQRLAAACKGEPPEPLEGWMEELYRRVSDRQTMGSVVQELRTSLSEAEKHIDQYFRKPAERQVLIPVPNQLAAMRGVLSVLGMDHASAALLRMRDEVDMLAATDFDPHSPSQSGIFERLAGNLGALGFLIDMLSVQPQLAKSLFSYDADAGTLQPVMGRHEPAHAVIPGSTPAAPAPVEQRLIEQAQMLAFTSVRDDVPLADVARDLERLAHEAHAADQPVLAATVLKAQQALGRADDEAARAAVRGELSEALVDFVATASEPAGLVDSASAERVTAPIALDFGLSTASATLAQDDEMRSVFLEEAREVLAEATSARADLAASADDLTLLTSLRRAFHTLKGSSRMVGLKDFGEAAWAGEQLYNAQLATQAGAPAALLEFTGWCLGYLSGWVDEIDAKGAVTHDAATVIAAAKAVGGPEQFAAPAAPPVAEAAEPAPPESAAEPAAAAAGPGEPFDLHLGTEPIPLPEALESLAAAEPALVPAGFEAPAVPEEVSDLHLVTEPMPFTAAVESPLADAGAVEPIDLDLDLELPADAGGLDRFETVAAPEARDSRGAPLDAALDASPRVPDPRTATPEDAPSPPEMAQEAVPQPEPVSAHGGFDDEHVKVVGPLRIGIPLFNIYLNEADELSRRLGTELAEWSMELYRPIGETSIALAHSLAGNSATVGFSDLSHLARALEHAQARSQAIGRGTAEEARLFVDTADEIRRLLHQFAAGFLKEPSPELLARLADHELSSARRLDAATAAAELPAVAGEPQREDAPGEASIADAETTDFEPPRDSIFGRHETGFGSLGLTELKPFAERPAESPRATPSEHTLVDADEVIDAVDAIDAELFPIFAEEAEELLPQLASRLREWLRKPGDAAQPAACMRTLHTLKGGARLAGAMRLGEMAHRLESRIERLMAQPGVSADEVETLQGHGDELTQTFEALRDGGPGDSRAAAEAQAAVAAPSAELEVLLEAAPSESGMMPLVSLDAVSRPAPFDAGPSPAPVEAVAGVSARVPLADEAPREPAFGSMDAPAEEPPIAEAAADAAQPALAAPASVAVQADIDWARFSHELPVARVTPDKTQIAQSAVRVRAPLLDRLVNQAGEVSITRSRIETGVGQIKASLADLTENLERLRAQLRDIEFHGEVQMTSRLEAAKAASQAFDPLEFDRFTRFQELTRMMAESVNDVATVQRTLQRSLEVTEDELVAQLRMTRELQDDLLRTRMVEFEGLSDRLYRVVRQAAKETGKSVRLDIVGGSIEIDRGVLDRMIGAFEHLLRNCVSHGIEAPEVRARAGKDTTGTIIVAVSHEGNEVGVEFRDDGAGLDLARIRAKGVALGLLDPDAEPTDADLANLIFAPGFSTAENVTELAGRGIGMDVVRAEVNAMGGRVETATAAGLGTSFKLILPLTTAVTQVVMLRCDETRVAVPSTLIEAVRRASPAEIGAAYASGLFDAGGDRPLPFFWLGALLQVSARPAESAGIARSVVVIRSAQQRVALHVDEVLGNQEVVVKNLGPQLSRLPGLAGITLLASGAVALIYNPVALATLYGEAARAATDAAWRGRESAVAAPLSPSPSEAPTTPLVMVVDDSLTVRRVTQRLLQREGYRVVLAKDGLDALERLAEEVPQIVLSDIEMPRMDGFDLVRNMRADGRLRELPVIMITSRIAQKHRDYAAELGVDHYLGKPYSEEDLLALIARYTGSRVAA